MQVLKGVHKKFKTHFSQVQFSFASILVILQRKLCTYVLLQALGSERKGKVAPSGYSFLFSDSHSLKPFLAANIWLFHICAAPDPPSSTWRNKSSDS